MKKILSAEEASQIIGCSAQRVRIRMQRKLWDLGKVIPPTKNGNKKWIYEIYRIKLKKFVEETGEKWIEDE